MNLLATLDTLGEATKAITKRRVQFGTTYTGSMGGLSSFGLNGWGNSYTIGGSPGAAVDYSTMVGDPLQNRVVAACINAKATAMSSAPSILEKRKGDDWERVDHPIIDLLNTPNEFKSGYELWYSTCASEDTQGQAFWRLEFDRSGVPGEIWVDHPDRYTVLGTGDKYISGYKFQTEMSGVVDLEDKEVIHFRRAPNLRNGRLGWTPLSAGARQVHGDNAAATYHTAILHNSGVMSLLISIKDGLQNQQGISPENMETFVKAVKHKLFGEGAGGIIGLNQPLDVHKMSYSPDEMAVDTLISYYEASICALLQTDPMVIGLTTGPENRTYSNMGEALRDFWERTIVPTNQRHDRTLNTQLLPLFGLDPAEYRLNRDYDDVAPLQENAGEVSTKVVAEYKAGIIDRFAAKTALHYDTEESDKEVYAAPAAPPPGEAEPGEPPAADKPKLQLVAGAKKSWDESQHARGGDSANAGRFSAHASSGAKYETGGGGAKIAGVMDAALSKQNISDAKKAEYAGAAHQAMAGMSHSTLRKLGENVKAVKFYENTQALDEHLSTALDDPDGTYGGGFDSGSGTLHLNGGGDSQGIYAHAMAHALDSDGDGGRISDGAAWQAAWSAEIVDRKAISSHAGSNAADGFAEFGRLVHGGYFGEGEVGRAFPECMKVWADSVG